MPVVAARQVAEGCPAGGPEPGLPGVLVSRHFREEAVERPSYGVVGGDHANPSGAETSYMGTHVSTDPIAANNRGSETP